MTHTTCTGLLSSLESWPMPASSTLDLTKGYHQLVINPKSKPIKSFSSLESLFQWKVLPLDMKTAGVVFQSIMDKVVGTYSIDTSWFT